MFRTKRPSERCEVCVWAGQGEGPDCSQQFVVSRRTWSLCSPTNPAPTSDRELGAEGGMLLKELRMLVSRWTYRQQSRRNINNHIHVPR